MCVRVVAPTSSRFGKGIICLLRTQGGVRWTLQKVIKKHESNKFSKMITVLYVIAYIDCRAVMTFEKFCRHGFLHLYVCTDGFGGLVVSMLASGTQVCGFKPGRNRWIFRT